MNDITKELLSALEAITEASKKERHARESHYVKADPKTWKEARLHHQETIKQAEIIISKAKAI